MEPKSLDGRDTHHKPARSLIVFGYGNPGRQDDGLGPAAAEEIAALDWPGVATQTNYQLNIEDADEAVKHDWVIFIDAADIGPEPYTERILHPAMETAFTSHVMGPEVILAICRDYYGNVPQSVLVAIRGYEFAFEEALSVAAHRNLAQAVERIKQLIEVRIGDAPCPPDSRTASGLRDDAWLTTDSR